MSALSEESGFTRLRDFGAFQTDISLIATHKIVAVKAESAASSASVQLSSFGGRFVAGGRALFGGFALRKGLLFFVRVGITVLLLVLLARSLSWSMLLAALAQIQIEGLLVAIVLGAGGIVVSS